MTFRIFQGDTGPIIKARPSALAEGDIIGPEWSCYVRVIDTQGAEVIPKAEVTIKNAENTRFLAYLTPDETEALQPDTAYTFAVQIENDSDTPHFRKERHFTIEVMAQAVPDS